MLIALPSPVKITRASGPGAPVWSEKPDPQEQENKERARALEQAAFIEAANRRQSDLAAFAQKQNQSEGGLAQIQEARSWIDQYNQKDRLAFTRPEFGQAWQGLTKDQNLKFMAGAEARQRAAEDSYRQDVLGRNLYRRLQETLADLKPENLEALDTAIETTWTLPGEAKKKKVFGITVIRRSAAGSRKIRVWREPGPFWAKSATVSARPL